MTKKDYEKFEAAFAKAIILSPDPVTTAGVAAGMFAIISVLADDNPKFDRDRFLGKVNELVAKKGGA